MSSAYFKNLNRRITTDKVLHDKAFNIVKFTKYYGINVDLVQWFINFLIKKLLVEQFKMKLYLENNYQKNLKKQLLQNLRKEKHFHFLKAKFAEQI